MASELGNVGSVNILALGTLAACTGVVRLASLEQLIRKRFTRQRGRTQPQGAGGGQRARGRVRARSAKVSGDEQGQDRAMPGGLSRGRRRAALCPAYPRRPLRRSAGRRARAHPVSAGLRLCVLPAVRGEVRTQPVRRTGGDPDAQAGRGGAGLAGPGRARAAAVDRQVRGRHRVRALRPHGGLLPSPAGARRDGVRGPGPQRRHVALRHSRLPPAR